MNDGLVDTQGHRITPESPVMMSLAKFGGVIVIVAGAVATAVGAYNHIDARLTAHDADIYRHLPAKFDQDHGAPVGHWDLINLEDRQTATRVKERAEDREALKDALENALRKHGR